MTVSHPTGSPFALRRSVWISLLAANAWVLLACLRMWWQPILADEWDFYRAITYWLQQRSLIPHPQAYIHLAQLSQAIFGQTIGAARLVGVFSAIVSLWLIPPLVHWVWPDRPQRDRVIVIAIVLTALQPLTLQNAMILDIDNTLLTPALMLLIITWVALKNRSARVRVAGMSGTLALAFWVKLPTPPLLMAAFGLYHLIRREWPRVVEVVLVSILGLMLFGATFAIYSQLSGYRFEYFAATFSRASGFFNWRELVARFPQGVGIFVMWLSLPLAILILIALARSLRRMGRGQAMPADGLGLYVIVVAIFYPLAYVPAWGYPRYQAPIVPIISVLVAALLAPYTLSLSRPAIRRLIAVTLAAAAFNLLFLPDPLWPIYQVTFEGDLFDLGRRLITGLEVATAIGLPIILVLAIGSIGARMRRIDGRATRIHLLGALTISSLAVVSLTQVTAGYSTRYRYTYDYADFLWSVRQAQAGGPSGYVLAIKDVLYESKMPGDEIYDYLCADCASKLIDAIHSRRIDVLVWTTKEDVRSSSVTANSKVVQALAECYDRSTRGVFIVYELKPDIICG